jgi:hypothetical protein
MGDFDAIEDFLKQNFDNFRTNVCPSGTDIKSISNELNLTTCHRENQPDTSKRLILSPISDLSSVQVRTCDFAGIGGFSEENFRDFSDTSVPHQKSRSIYLE